MIEQYQGLIYKVVLGVVGPTLAKSDVDDIVQDVNVKLIDGALDQYDPARGEITTFIGIVTRNLTYDSLRKRSRIHSFNVLDDTREDLEGHEVADSELESFRFDTSSGGEDGFAAPGLDALTLLIRAENEARLATAIKTLDASDRLFLQVVLSDNFDTESYAAKRGLTPVAIRVRKHRLAEKLREMIRQLDQD